MTKHLLFFLSFLLWIHQVYSQKNVLFIICDDLNCDLESYGHPLVKTPNLTRLASRGMQFNQAHCQYSLCGPSRASIMTGLYPHQNLVLGNSIYIRERLPKVITMSEIFKNSGYHALRIGKIYHYNVPKHIGTGGHDDPYSWNETLNPRGRDVIDEEKVITLKPGRYGATLSWLAAEGTDEEQTDGIAATWASKRLTEFAQKQQPFFLAVGLYRPHTPYVAPKKYFDMYPKDKIKIPKVPEGYLETIPAVVKKSLLRFKEQNNLSEDVAKDVLQSYYASISFADAQIGRILDTLDKTGLSKNTVVVFTSDHGYHMGEHGYYQKLTLFENSTHVPLIISDPDMSKTAGQKSDSLVELVDLYPTLVDLCKKEAPFHISGKSLRPILENPNNEIRKSALNQISIRGLVGDTVKTTKYRYTSWGENGKDGEELYDHQNDSAELNNLIDSPEYAQILKDMKKELNTRVKQAAIIPPKLNRILP